MDKLVIRGGNPCSAPSASAARKMPHCLPWPPPCSPKSRSSSKTFPRYATSRPRATCWPPWAPKSNSATDAPSTAPPSAAGIWHAPEASYELVKTMRASTLVLGPLVARCGRARVSLPGGCAIGADPSICTSKDSSASAPRSRRTTATWKPPPTASKALKLSSTRITVTGTEDLLMAATLAEGETVLENCAREPEVADLAALC
jgi:UDP-N-acetylglucosamine 1-carboxyvinyltransferase